MEHLNIYIARLLRENKGDKEFKNTKYQKKRNSPIDM